MKTDKIIFKVINDSIYSGISKYECTASIAEQLTSGQYPEYFKTFREAKKALISEMAYHTTLWVDALKQAKKLKSTEIDF